MKPVRKAVRTFLINDNKVIAIKYTTNDYKQDFYDIPGGGIVLPVSISFNQIKNVKI